MDLEVAEAGQEVAEAKAALNNELAKPAGLIAQLSPDDIADQITLLKKAQDNLKQKSNHLRLVKEAQAKISRGQLEESFEEIVKQYERHPSRVAAQPAPTQTIERAFAPVALSTVLPKPPHRAEYVTLVVPTEISIQYGKITLPPGKRLEVLSRDATSVTVKYLGETVVLPLSSTKVE